MPEITTIAELVDQIGSVITFPDPLGELRTRGFILAPDVQARLDAAAQPARLDPARRQQLATLAGRLGPVRTRVTGAAHPTLQPLTASLGYDVTVGLRVSVLDDTLAALSEGMRYPREVSADIPRQLLDDLSADIPPDVSIGPIRLTAPATVSAIDGTDHLLLALQFSLEFRRTFRFGPGAPRQVTVSSFDATARFGVAVSAIVVNDTIQLGIDTLLSSGGATGADRLVLTVAPDSPVQPRSPAALSDFANFLDGPLRAELKLELGDPIYSVSPVIRIPLGGTNTNFTIRDIGVRPFSAPDGDVIVAAVRFDTPDQPDLRTGDPATLANPFPAGEQSELNTYVRITETALRKVVRAMQRSGALTNTAREFEDDLRVDGADVQLAPNEVKLILDVRKVDACPVLFGSIDLGARVTVTFNFSVFEGRVSVTASADVDLDNTDAAACVIGNPLLILFAATGNLVGTILTTIYILGRLEEGGEARSFFEIFPAIFDSSEPVTGTEVLPIAETIQALVSEDHLEALGNVSLRPDNINTYVYAQFMRSSPQLPPIPGAGQLGQPPTPIRNVVVQLMDQDFPRPAGDDAQPPAYSHTTTSSTPPGDPTTTTTRTTTVTFVAPTGDQELARETTDDQGRVQFVLTPADLRNSAGEVVTTVDTQITRRTATEVAVSERGTTVTRRGVTENLPDVYFRVTPPDEPAFDTRLADNGFVINLRSRRIGTAAAPLLFLTGRQGPVVLG